MKKLTLFFLVGLFITGSLTGQDKLLTIEDVSYMNRSLFPARVAQLQWIGDTDYYAYAKENALYKVSAKRGTETLLIDLDMLNTGLHNNGYDSIKRLPSIKFHDDESCYFSANKVYYNYNYSAHQLKKINHISEEKASNIEFHPQSGNIAFTIENNLYCTSRGVSIQVTKETDPGIVCGQTVHRNEFGISGGIFWSPDGSKLAFYRKDETMVTDYPLVDVTQRIAEVSNTKYPMAGMTSEEVTLGVYDLEKDVTLFLKTGEPKDQYLTTVTWGPGGKYIYVGILNRDQNHLKLNQYNASTGDFIKTLFEETHEKYVEPEDPLYFNPTNADEFIWVSEKDGYNHLYLYKTSGELVKQLTKGEWVVMGFNGFYGDHIYFVGTKESPLQKNIYTVNLKSGEIIRVSPNHGTHSARVSANGKFIIDIFSSTDHSRVYKVLNHKGKELRVIQEDNQPLKDYNLGEMEFLTLKAGDGTELQARLIKPINFEASKKYPVIVYVYGGPHAQLVTDSWLGGAGLFLNYLAQQGFVVFTLDNRGSANRGRDFEQAIFRNLGDFEMEDQMVGIEYLKSLQYVDANRIGVDGWSYGGFMTTSLMVRHPETFKVGVAGGPVIDWQYYEIMYGERYMDTPEQNPEGYEKSNLLNYVDDLEGKLLLIHGTADPTVVWQHSLRFVQEAISKGKQMDYFVYPGHGHGVRGTDRIHLNQKIADYFINNL